MSADPVTVTAEMLRNRAEVLAVYGQERLDRITAAVRNIAEKTNRDSFEVVSRYAPEVRAKGLRRSSSPPRLARLQRRGLVRSTDEAPADPSSRRLCQHALSTPSTARRARRDRAVCPDGRRCPRPGDGALPVLPSAHRAQDQRGKRCGAVP